MQKTWVQSLAWEDPLEKEMAAHSNILVWEIPWTEEPGGLQCMWSQRGKHNLATEQQQQRNKWILGSYRELIKPKDKCTQPRKLPHVSWRRRTVSGSF